MWGTQRGSLNLLVTKIRKVARQQGHFKDGTIASEESVQAEAGKPCGGVWRNVVEETEARNR